MIFAFWDGPTRGEFAIKVAFLEQQLMEATQREAYWRTRAEMFLDRATARAGLSHEPVMRERTPEQILGALPPFAGAGLMEFDSTKTQ